MHLSQCSIFLFLATLALSTVVGQETDIQINGGIRPRNSAPSFKAKSVIDDKFKDIALSDYTSKGLWVVLVIASIS